MHHNLIAPDLGIGPGPVTVSLWLVELGGEVAEGAPVVELLAGPAVVDLGAPAAGTLIKRLVDEDDVVRPGQTLGIIESPAIE